MKDVTAGSMQWSGLKVQRISCIEMTHLESKGEGNGSTFSSVLPTSSLLARFRRVSFCDQKSENKELFITRRIITLINTT
jgi:hypothetical protein